MASLIPIPKATASTVRVKLGDDVYTFGLRWNVRANTWLLDVGDAEGTILVAGIALRVGHPLLKQHVTPGLPSGHLIAHDTTGDDRDPGLGDLGNRVILAHMEDAELRALGTELGL